MELNKLTLKEAMEGLEKKKFKATEVAMDCLKSIEKLNPKLHAFLAEATTDTLNYIASPLGQLKGLPLAIKDNILTKQFKTTASSNV